MAAADTSFRPDHPWALLPLPTRIPGKEQHISAKMAEEMVHVHNCYIRSINAIYQQAPRVSAAKDAKDFSFLVKVWCVVLHDHHHLEETIAFPRFEAAAGKPGLMAGNAEQHHAFEPGLEELQAWALRVVEQPAEYDAHELMRIIDGFAGVLQQHLAEEIGTLLQLHVVEDEQALRDAWEATAKEALKQSKYEVFPFVFGTCDRDAPQSPDARFPPVPWFVPWIIHYWHERKYAGSWRFLPYDTWGRKRPLPAAA